MRVTTANYSEVNRDVAQWILLDRIYQVMCMTNAPTVARLWLLKYRLESFSGSIEDFIFAVKFTTGR